jgi:MOSC domain-containing protein YiiM
MVAAASRWRSQVVNTASRLAFVLSRIEPAMKQTEVKPATAECPAATSCVLASIQVSLPRTFGEEGASDPMDRVWTTGYYKELVSGPVLLRHGNLDGDGQADLVHHSGPDKAVLAYAAAHYAAWRQTLNQPSLPHGSFGENFTLERLKESDVCIGDTWLVGDEAVVQVSQPRQPCWKMSRRWRIKSLALQVQQTGRTGWYFRVLKEGLVAAGMPLVLQDRPHPQWTVDRANHVMHVDRANISATLELAALPLLSENWRKTLKHRTENQKPDSAKRLIGEND